MLTCKVCAHMHTRAWTISHFEYLFCIGINPCYTMLYVMGFTSGTIGSESNNLPYLIMNLRGTGGKGEIRLPNNPGVEMTKYKGDLWRVSISSLFKGRRRCVRKTEVLSVIIRNGGNDGWRINSIVTMLQYGPYCTLLTGNVDFNRAIDGNLNLTPSTRQIFLTRAQP